MFEGIFSDVAAQIQFQYGSSHIVYKTFFLFEIKILLFEFLGQSGFENTLVKFFTCRKIF